MSDAERELELSDEHEVTPLELFFDLVFVFALTQVTSLLADDPTWGAAVLLALIPAAVVIPALAALALVSAVCSLVVAYEVFLHREHRVQVRHPELAA